METDPDAFEVYLAREIVQSERLRMAILAGLSAVMIVFWVLMYTFHRDTYLLHFGNPAVIVNIVAVLAFLLCYELVLRQVLARRLARGGGAPHALRYLNALIETSVPSVVIVAVASEINPMLPLQSAASLLYGVFIVLSTLRLDFRLSVFTGMVAAIEFVVLSRIYATTGGDAIAGTLPAALPFYLTKGAVLMLSGLAAGFVAHQLRSRVGSAFRAQEERQRILGTFGQQVSPEIVEELLRCESGAEGRRAFVCVMFMDIRNFTPMVEGKTPEEIVAFQNTVFGAGIEVVNRHRGIINQFLGDGFMATFGTPLTTADDCRNALAAARDLVARVAELSASGRIPAIRIGIGLHAGEAVCGNVGSALRKQYSITGNVVILASRIEQLNKEYGSQILASAEVIKAGGEQAHGAALIGPVLVKGRNEPIEIYRLA